jgi:competence protein ComEA
MAKLSMSRLRALAPVRAIAAFVSVMIMAIALPANGAQATKPAAGELGIGVEILPTQSDNPAQLGANSEMWFAIEPGQSAQRQFRIISTSDIVQSVVFELWQVTVVDGEPIIDRTTRSPSEEWVTFNPPKINLEPRGRQDVTMTYTIPANTEPAVFESYLRILVSARDAPVDENPNAGVQAVIQGALAFRKSVWLGIGDAANLATDLEISGVAGWLTDKNEKAVRVLITNTGNTPIRPTGSVQIADPLFADNTFGPFEFRTNSINPGDSAYGDAIVDPAITDGRWSLFVQATQGSIRKTAKFDQEIRFDRSLDEFGSAWKWATRIGVGALGLGLIVAGYALMRGKRSKREGDPPTDDPLIDDTPAPNNDPSSTPPPQGTNAATVEVATEHQVEQPTVVTPTPSDPIPPVVTPTPSDPIPPVVTPTPSDPIPSVVTPTPSDPIPSVVTPTPSDPIPPVVTPTPSDPIPPVVTPPPTIIGRVVVHVSGAVRNPGMFEVNDDTRVGEAIELAGGTTTIAETAEINFARRVVDGEQIFVPKRVVGSREAKPVSKPAVLDLNLATGKQLADLPGVGQDLGAAIVAYRRRIGKFTSIEQLLEVKGIGPRKLAGIKKRVRV